MSIRMKELCSDKEMKRFRNQKNAFGAAIWAAGRTMLAEGVYLTFDALPTYRIDFRIQADRSTVIVTSYYIDSEIIND